MAAPIAIFHCIYANKNLMKGCGFLDTLNNNAANAPAKKYNVLINGRNMSIVMDFITHSEAYFKCLSTSDCWQDVLGHFELFKPDIYLCFVDSVYSKILTQTNALRGDSMYNDAPIFVVADEETYDELEQNPRPAISVVIKRPISTDNLILRMTMHLEQREQAAKKEKEREAERIAKIEERRALAEREENYKKAAAAAQIKKQQKEEAKKRNIWESWDEPIFAEEKKPVKFKALEPSANPDPKPIVKVNQGIKQTEPNTAKETSPAASAASAKAAPSAAAPAAPARQPNTSGKKHILIVDDDRTVLKMLKTALEDEYDITTMVNGVMVEKYLTAKEVNMVILDYEMPGLTGADIFRKLKVNELTSNIPVCFLTGISDREKIMEVMSLRPHSYLLKPIDMDMLKAAITNLT